MLAEQESGAAPAQPAATPHETVGIVPSPASQMDDAPASARPVPKRGYLELERDDSQLINMGGLKGTSPLWVIAANNVVYMAAPLSLPATMAACGWFWGTLILGYSILCTYHSGVLLGDVIIERPHLDSYPKVLGEAFAVWTERYADGYVKPDMMRRVGSELAVALQFLAYFFDSTAQILYCAQYFDQLLPNSPVCQHQWLLIVWLLSVPLMQVCARAAR